MSGELRRQLRDALGPGVDGLERAVALEIADEADEYGEARIQVEDLACWTGESVAAVETALARLRMAGWEFQPDRGPYRVPELEGGALWKHPEIQ